MPLNLVVQTAFLGDLLLCTPLLKQIKTLWPETALGLVCRKGFGDFFLKTGLVDRVFEIQKGQTKTYQKALSELASCKVDHLISPHESLRTGLFCRQIQARHKISFRNWWSFWIYPQRQFKDLALPDALRQLSLLRAFDPSLDTQMATYRRTAEPYKVGVHGKLPAPPPWASMSVRDRLQEDQTTWSDLCEKFALQKKTLRKRVLLFPGSVWATKRWTEEGYTQVGQRLHQQGCEVLVMGGPGEEELAERVAAQIPESRSLAGKTSIYESAQIILHSDLLIGNDSASTHLAASCETPLIAIFGPTILEFGFRPWSAQSYVIEILGLKCRPCGKHGHHKCPIGTHECMKRITAEDVLKTARTILPDTLSR